MPKTTPPPPGPHGTAPGSRCGKRLSPHLRIPVITRSIACSRAPHATQRALSAHTQARSQPQPTVDRATGTAVQLYRYAAADPQPVSASLHGYHCSHSHCRPSARQHLTPWLPLFVPRGTVVDHRGGRLLRGALSGAAFSGEGLLGEALVARQLWGEARAGRRAEHLHALVARQLLAFGRCAQWPPAG